MVINTVDQGVTLVAYLLVKPRLRMHGAVPLRPHTHLSCGAC
jgi:hypothetical protein